MGMNRKFNPDNIRAEIANLTAQRDSIDEAIKYLESGLRHIEHIKPDGVGESSSDKPLITLQDAVKQACYEMIDGISRPRVMDAVIRTHPYVKPVSSSVSAALINFSRGPDAILQIAVQGKGQRPTVYALEGEKTIKLMKDEILTLIDADVTKGIGGWQTLWATLQKQFDKATGCITLSAQMRAKIWQYYHGGKGGWQDKARKVFQRELPHLFA